MRRVNCSLGQQGFVDAEHVSSVFVVDFEQVAWRAMIRGEMVQMSLAALAQAVESAQPCTHEREDGLLFVAEIHDGERTLFTFRLSSQCCIIGSFPIGRGSGGVR